MRRRNNKIQEFILPNGAKPTCAKIGKISPGVMVSGDNQMAVAFWNISKEKPLFLLNAQNTPQVASEVTSISFSATEREIFSGSSRGPISTWDIPTQKQQTILKGHTVSVTALTSFLSEDQNHLLISGSYDTNIKLWDLRQKACVNTFKGHNMQVNTVQVSPDSRWIASGSQDGLVKIWDISTFKVLSTFTLHDGPVTNVRFNPQELSLASASFDRTVKYWDLERFEVISSSRPEATPIQQICFDKEGKVIFSAAHESLKVWNIEKNDAILVDNVESAWRGIVDLALSDKNEALLGIAITQVYFGLWAVPLKSVNFDPSNANKEGNIAGYPGALNVKREPDVPTRPRPEFQVPTNQHLSPQNPFANAMAGYPSNDNRDVGVKKPAIPPERANAAPRTGEYLPPMANIQRPADNAMHPEPHYPRAHSLPEERPPSSYHPKEHSMSPPRQEHPSHMNEPPSMPMDEIVRPNTGDRGRIDQEYDRFMNERDSDRMINEAAPEAQNRPNSQLASMIIGPRDKPLGLNASSFLIEDESKHKTAEFDLINELLKEDSKFKGVMTQKLNYLKPILHWWNSNNIKSALNAIERINEPWVLNDVFNMVIQTNKLGNLNVEAITIFVAKSRILIESRFQVTREIVEVKKISLILKWDLILSEGHTSNSEMR
eukprot:TRINITY_DN1530_c0_g1_i2.p1 TRINITY_DN1530_c0_g1~~TRINITY_DN1530_c0_g1_i2.p1  ORF type:complete len:661 (+),score=111.07 TRINITY_DN1530_c0_g1_i2:114-2096(+)